MEGERSLHTEAVEKVLEQLRPYFHKDGGDITLEEISEDLVVKVKLHGSCRDCSMKIMTMRAGVTESIRKAIPEIKDVVEVN
jgi:Fe-S cluster biogenesis protein NfuA